ncbi:hypothetical protein AGENTSMITH_178 [Bacillus phage vB_BspM_AgentSmith]|nr:hypothetical protein AGENTSMITH_178 [Bacillus phage vB_BspM_AgentSmith]
MCNLSALVNGDLTDRQILSVKKLDEVRKEGLPLVERIPYIMECMFEMELSFEYVESFIVKLINRAKERHLKEVSSNLTNLDTELMELSPRVFLG